MSKDNTAMDAASKRKLLKRGKNSSADSQHQPSSENVLSASTETRGSLWRQYSLLEEPSKVKQKRDGGLCFYNDRYRPCLLRASFLISVALGLFFSMVCLRFSVYAPTRFSITGGDQMLLPASTFMNRKLKVELHDQTLSKYMRLYVLKKLPPISNHTVSLQSGGVFYLTSWTYEYWGFNLLEGTTLKISLCADLHLQFYIIKGDKKLKRWTQEPLFTEYDYHQNVRPKSNCEEKENFVSHLLTVSKSDTYYLFFTTSVGWRFLTRITAVLAFNRTYYDLSDSLYSCRLNESSCFANLSFGSDDITLLHAVQNSSLLYPNPFTRINFKSIPIPRTGFYIKLYGSIYLAVVGLTVLYVIYRCIMNYFSCSYKKDSVPLLSNQRAYLRAYSLRSTSNYQRSRGKNSWVVVSPVATEIIPVSSNESDHMKYEFSERDNESILSNHERARRSTLLSDLSLTSRESNFLMESQYECNMRQAQQLMDEQQLLDSVMTSASVSAI